MSPNELQARSAFLAETVRTLEQSAPEFDYKGLAEAGLQQGVLSLVEAEALVLRGSFPAWLANRLTARQRTDRIDDPGETLVSGQEVPLAKAAASNAPGCALLEAFVPGRVAVAPLRAIRIDHPARHSVQNFRKLVWSLDGIHGALSDDNGIVLRPFLEPVVPRHLPGRALMAVVEGSMVYTHWLLDTFPRFLALREAGTDPADFDHVVLATTARGFHRTLLARLGIDPARVVTRQHDGGYFETDASVHLSAPRTNFATHPRIYDMVCAHFGQPQAPKGQTRRFFVSRSGAGRRKILNEEALFALLEPEGFEVIRFEDHDMEEMAALMAQASHIIAPHGAGLANLVFCRPGARVLEIFSAHLSREYWIIAQQKGLAYHAFEAEGPEQRPVTEAERRAMPFLDRNGLDIYVPLGPFRDYLKEVFLA